MKSHPWRKKAFPRVVLLAISVNLFGCASEAERRGDSAIEEAVPVLGEDAADLGFRDFFVTPIGPRELKLTEKLRSLDGRRVRIAGYRVHQETPIPGRFLLTARPLSVHEGHYGLAEDLPPATMLVLCPGADPAYTPGMLDVVGRLRLGNREEPDGRISVVRLELERVEGTETSRNLSRSDS